MATESLRPRAWQLVVGCALITWGVLRLAEELDLPWAEPALTWLWPVALLAVGAALFAQDRSSRLFGLFFLGLGGFGVVTRLVEAPALDLGDVFFPGLLMLGGGALLWRVLSPGADTDRKAGDTVNHFAIMGGHEVRSLSRQFAGGSLTAVMGGCELDLTGAGTPPEGAVLDVFTMWGGIEIRVPRDWEVISRVTPVMGAVEDTRGAGVEGAPAGRLTLRGIVLMAGVEIKN
ncbi:MAG: LiaF transmembrane domain-containing protein [Thermoanaerobaculia bacterium]